MTSLEGRTIHQLVHLPGGRKKHAVLFAHMFEELSEKRYGIIKFKVIQCALDHFKILIDLDNPDTENKLTALLTDRLSEELGPDISFKIIFGKIDQSVGTKYSYFEPLHTKLVRVHPETPSGQNRISELETSNFS